MKYKAFDNKNKRWLSGFLINSDGKVLIRGQDFSVELKEIDATLCRGTGLRDCKRTKEFPDGQEIFENDIVKFYYYGEEKDSNLSIGMIRYSKRRASFMIKIDDNISSILLCENIPTSMCITDPDTNIEIIGNIFDTPHLLEKN